MATVARDVADLEYFERTHTLYAPMERVDMYVTWNYRRDREGRKDYRGGMLWHEGEIRFKKDAPSRAPCRFPCSGIAARPTWPGTSAQPSSSPTRTVRRGWARFATKRSPWRSQGRIRPGGYAALLTTPVGYHGLLVPADMDFAYQVALPSYSHGLLAGLGRDGQQVKAGTVLKYRFGVGTFTDARRATPCWSTRSRP